MRCKACNSRLDKEDLEVIDNDDGWCTTCISASLEELDLQDIGANEESNWEWDNTNV